MQHLILLSRVNIITSGWCSEIYSEDILSWALSASLKALLLPGSKGVKMPRCAMEIACSSCLGSLKCNGMHKAGFIGGVYDTVKALLVLRR